MDAGDANGRGTTQDAAVDRLMQPVASQRGAVDDQVTSFRGATQSPGDAKADDVRVKRDEPEGQAGSVAVEGNR